jgi:hypothetical protein
MSDESNDQKGQKDSMSELRDILNELSEEIEESNRDNLFKMAEFLYALDVKVEACQIEMSNGTTELGLVIPIHQFSSLRKALVGNAI